MRQERVFVMAVSAMAVALLGTAAPATVHAGIGSSMAAAPRESERDKVIRRAFDDILNREPSDRELRRYRELMEDDNWSARDVRDDLKRRESSSSSRRSDRRSSSEEAERIVRRAYQDILGREPDEGGLRSYRRRIVDDDWSEDDVRESLRKSPEYRQKRSAMTHDRAEEIVRRAYLSVLGREPDPDSRVYVDRVLRDRWSEEQVARELRKSPEYRAKHR